jgi:hypothetical protein
MVQGLKSQHQNWVGPEMKRRKEKKKEEREKEKRIGLKPN